MILLIINNLKKYKYLYSIISVFLILRIINLTSVPLFNDESIYLDWGFREINRPGFLYYSLYDAKQPLLMWIFGIMGNLLADPIFAGRIVSVFAGVITLLGIYKITNYISDKKTALLACVLYIFIPLFSFYERQALMEASVSAIGVWSGYFLLKSQEQEKYLDYILLGLTLGVGYFIKSTTLIFLTASYLLIIINIFRVSKKDKIVSGLTLSILCFIGSIFLLIINPAFWQSLSSNSRFALTVSELLKFPFSLWINSFVSNLKTSFFYITPVIFILGILGTMAVFKNIDKRKIHLAFYFLIPLIIETLIVKSSSDRYLVCFLPLIVIFAAMFILSFIVNKKNKNVGLILIIFAIATSLPLTFWQIFNQPDYLKYYSSVSGVSYSNYLDTFTSGYGLDEVYLYFNKIGENKKIVIGIAMNTGNPESGIQVYYEKNSNIKVVYFDSRLLPAEIANYDCIDVGIETYFVSRENQLVGLDKYLKNLKIIKNSYGNNTIGIYELKTHCLGKTATLNLKQN